MAYIFSHQNLKEKKVEPIYLLDTVSTRQRIKMKACLPLLIIVLCKKFLQLPLKGEGSPLDTDAQRCAFLFNRVYPLHSLCSNASSNASRPIFRDTTPPGACRFRRPSRTSEATADDMGLYPPVLAGGDYLLRDDDPLEICVLGRRKCHFKHYEALIPLRSRDSV